MADISLPEFKVGVTAIDGNEPRKGIILPAEHHVLFCSFAHEQVHQHILREKLK